jgi:4a-hydroxytetrahydrobiopterin dehydratase
VIVHVRPWSVIDHQEPDGIDGMTPAEFHSRPGVAQWGVTAWGPQACFRSTSLSHAAGLVPEVVDAAGRFDVSSDIDVRPEAVVVRVPYRRVERIASGVPDFAAAISSAARRLGLVADPSLIQTVNIAVAQHADTDTRPFWAAALGFQPLGDMDAVDPLRRGPHLSFQSIGASRRGRTHIDVSVPEGQALLRVNAAIAAGGRMADDSHAPQWWTLASPDNHGVDIAAWNDTAD